MKKLISLAAIVLLAVALTGCKDKEKEKQIAAYEKEAKALLDSCDYVGISAVVVKDNKIYYNSNYGVKDLETGEPIDDQTMFRIASISKSFTATSMMQLVEQGKVSLDDKASDLVGIQIQNPKYPDVPITLELLMSHLSSLNDHQGYYTLDGVNPETNPDYAEAYRDFAPGEQYRYTNLNFSLSGTILERVSGERFDQYVVHHVLEPLGLYGGYCIDSLDASRFAQIYSWNDETGGFEKQPEAYAPRKEIIDNYRFGYDTPVFSPTGGMKISALDLAKYMIMHMNYGYSPLADVRIISEESSRNMQTPRSDYENYGLALHQDDSLTGDGTVLEGHTGGAYGLSAGMFFNPEEKYGFVVISSGYHNTAEGKHSPYRSIIPLLYKNFIACDKADTEKAEKEEAETAE